MDAAADIAFDFEGSLDLARRLWALADQVEETVAGRRGLATAALATWRGEFADEFAARIDTETTELSSIAVDLRSTAMGWAACWQAAMDEQNRIRYAREVERIEHDLSLLDRGWGAVFGHDDLPPMPEPVAAPAAPGFAPTASVVRS